VLLIGYIRRCLALLSLGVAMTVLSTATPLWAMPVQSSMPNHLSAIRLQHSEYLDLQAAHDATVVVASDQSNPSIAQLSVAIAYLTRAVEKNPTMVLACYSLAMAYLERAKTQELLGTPLGDTLIQDDLLQSEQALLRVQSLNQDISSVSFKLGKLAILQHRPQQALEYYQLGLTSDPDNASLHFNVAGLYEQLGHTPLAIKHYQQAVKHKPGFTFALNNLGLLYEKLKQPNLAMHCYKQALKADHAYSFARLNLGTLYAEQNQLTMAEKCFRQVLVYHPENAWAYLYLGNLAFKQGQYNKAVTHYQASIQHNHDYPTTYYLLAVSLVRLDRYGDAAQVGKSYLSQYPTGGFAPEMAQLVNMVAAQQQQEQHIQANVPVRPAFAK
jgi:tetratricopeptide (TPR) repeat protein